MSKAEEMAKELFPLLETDKIGNNPYISYNTEQLSKQEGFIKGYHQAEKDLELRWEDIETIQEMANKYCKYHSCEPRFFVYQEVFKRFKEKKREKV